MQMFLNKLQFPYLRKRPEFALNSIPRRGSSATYSNSANHKLGQENDFFSQEKQRTKLTLQQYLTLHPLYIG